MELVALVSGLLGLVGALGSAFLVIHWRALGTDLPSELEELPSKFRMLQGEWTETYDRFRALASRIERRQEREERENPTERGGARRPHLAPPTSSEPVDPAALQEALAAALNRSRAGGQAS